MMKRKIIILFAIMSIVTFACNFGTKANNNNTAQPKNNASPSTAAQAESNSGSVQSAESANTSTSVKTSNLSSGTYTYTNRNVIRDLAEKDGIIYAATLGGLTIWDLQTGNIMDIVPTQGMSDISANAVVYCEIPEPRIIVGTLHGISIFDPVSGTWDQNTILPQDNWVNSSKIEKLHCDQQNNRLLLGYSGLGVLDLKTGDYQQYTDQNGLLWNSVQDITVNGKDIWIASGYKGIAKISNGQVTTYSKTEGMQDEVAYAVEFTSDGTLWVGANSGLMSFKNSTWTMYGLDSEAKLASINEMVSLSGNILGIATAPLGTGRVCFFNTSTHLCEKSFDDPDNTAILALTMDSSSTPIFGNSKGIKIIKDDQLVSLKTQDQLLSNYVDSLVISPDGMLWIGTDNGVQVLDPINPNGSWTSYQISDNANMGGNWATAISFAKNGTMWAATINGSASRFDQNQWQAFKDIYSFNTVAMDAQNRAWFADDGKGIIILDENGNQAMTLTTADGLPSDNVQALLLDTNGTMWIGTNQGFAKYENNTLSTVFGSDSKDLPNIYIRALSLDQDGNILLGTFTGVAKYDGSTATTLIDFLKDGFNEARLTNLACTSTGQIWIGTDQGVIYGDGSTGWNLLNTKNGLLTNYVSALTVDQFDSIWIGGGGSNFDSGGLLHIVP
jgi:ligand-binding sensor domain-containing protein